MDFAKLLEAVENSSAIRRMLKLLPVGGDGSYVAPPTYAGDSKPMHVFEVRRMGSRDVQCVLLDSVQSQANRLEGSLKKGIESGDVSVPHTYVDFAGTPIKDVGKISALDAPHRIYDAIVRDSEKDGTGFPDTHMGRVINDATPHNAYALFKYSPSTLIFGGWNSTGERGGSGPRFQRCIVSEIIGVDVPISSGGNTGPESCMKPSSRIDPLGIERVDVYMSKDEKLEWSVDPIKGAKKVRPSDVNHGNIPPSVLAQGVTIDHALQTTVVTLAGMRNLSFPDDDGRTGGERDAAARAVLAALSLYAITRNDDEGYSLRSRCDLYPDQADLSAFEIIHNDGKIEKVHVTSRSASELLKAAVDNAAKHGITWEADPVVLTPGKELIKLVQKSRAKSLQGD